MSTKLSLLFISLLLVACSSPSSSSSPDATSSPTAPTPSASSGETPVVPEDKVAFATVKSIVDQRCAVCHSQSPTQPGFSGPAGGVSFDTPAEIKDKASRIRARAVSSQSMPQGNVTNMTDAERETLGKWIEEGANL